MKTTITNYSNGNYRLAQSTAPGRWILEGPTQGPLSVDLLTQLRSLLTELINDNTNKQNQNVLKG